MKTVKRTIYFPKFNEKCNDFEYEGRTYERPMTEQERNLMIRYRLLIAFVFATIISYSIGLLLALATKVDWTDLALIPITFVWGWLVVKMFKQGFKWEDEIACFNDHGFEAERLLYDQVAQEEKHKAEKWRAEHPLEEAIRKAQKTKNCNDIATLLRLYQSGDLKM